MHTTEFFDETFDINQTSSYHIFLLAQKSGFSYAVLDITRKKYIAFKSFPIKKDLSTGLFCEEVDKIIQKESILNKKFKRSRLLFATNKFTFIPSALFAEDNVRAVFEFNHFLEGNEELHYNKLNPIDAYNVFAVPNHLANSINEQFNGVEFYHHSSPLINYIARDDEKGDRVNVNIQPDFIDIAAFKNQSLTFYNTFGYRNNKDIIYYILYVYYLLNISPRFSGLTLSGFIDKHSELHKLIGKYIREVGFARRRSINTYSYTLRDIDQHKYIPLLTMDE